MSRDSLNGTITRTNILQSNVNQHEQPIPISESNITGLIPSTEVDLQVERASANIQRWSRENRKKIEQEKSTDDEQRSTPRVKYFNSFYETYILQIGYTTTRK